jgi:23S rRNA pseudouridine1911/1915/1917 synthase
MLADRIKYENAAFLIFDKPAHQLVHPKKPGGSITLWHQLSDLLAYERANGGQVSVITRLDRETSGLVLVAKTQESARILHRSVKAQLIHKTYLAIASGWSEPDVFEVDQPLLRLGTVMRSRIWLKQAVHSSGYPSRTRFKVVQRFKNTHGKFSLIECVPLTGRTHQIRVHLSFAGHPIVGDKIYGPDETCYLEFIKTGWTPALVARLLLDRQALHAACLEFNLGSDHYRFDSPLPEDLKKFRSEN